MAAKIKKGDEVLVITGKEKGKRGRVIEIMPKDQKVKVEGLNMRLKHFKKNGASSREHVECSMHISNVAVCDPKTGFATRTRFKTLDDGSKVRIAVKSNEVIASA